MSVVASQLISKVSSEGVEKTKAELESVGKKNDEISKKIGDGLKLAALGGAAAVIGIGVVATKMAGDFQSGVTTLVTGAGELEKNLGMISAGLLKMSVSTGTSTSELTKGLYMIESAGFHGAAGLKVLQAAAEGAKVGNAELGTVADAVTTIMVDYAKTGLSAAQATNILVATVAAGKTHMQDLAGAMSSVLPTASRYRVSLVDVTAAMATMTAAGVPAADAATYLRQTIVGLGSGSPGAIKALKEIGLSADQVNQSMQKSLPATLQMIEDHLKKKFPEGSHAFNEALKAIAGGSKQMQGMLDLTGDRLKVFKADVVDITGKVNKAGDSVSGWSLIQKDFNFKLEQGHAALDVFLIQLGTSLLPLVSELIAYFTSQLLPRLSDFSTWFAAQGVPALQSFGSTLGPIVTDLIGFAQWLAQGSPPAHALTTAALALAGAIALVKIANIVGDMAGFIAAAPQMVMKLLFVQGAATGVTGSMAGIGVAAETSAGEVALSSVAEEGSLAKVALAGDAAATGIKGIGLTAAGAALLLAPLVLAMKWLIDNHSAIIDTASGVKGMGQDMPGKNDPGNPLGISFQNPYAPGGALAQVAANEKQASDATKRLASDTKISLDQISQDYLAFVNTNGISWLKFEQQAADARKQVAKDAVVAQSEWAQSVERGVGYMTTAIDRAQSLEAQHVERTVGDMTTANDRAQSEWAQSVERNTAKVEGDFGKVASQAKEMRARLIALNGPYEPIVNIGSILNAGAAASNLKWQLGQLNNTVNAGAPMSHFASGTQDYPGGVGLVGEQGPELVNLPRGTTITPADKTAAMLGGGNQQQPINVNVYLNGRALTSELMPHIVSQIRSAVGTVNI